MARRDRGRARCAGAVPPGHLPAGMPGGDRRHRLSRWRRVVRPRAPRAHHHRHDGEGDPPDRARRGGADPRRDARGDLPDRLVHHRRRAGGAARGRALRRLRRAPAHGPPLLRAQRGRAAHAVPRRMQADRRQAPCAVRDAAAQSVRGAGHPPVHGTDADDRVLHARLAARGVARVVLRQHPRARPATALRGVPAVAARGGARAPPAGVARAGARRTRAASI